MKKASMLHVKNNLKWLMSDRISASALSEATGVPQPTIFRILTGESSDPRTSTLQPLAEYFKVTVADLRDRDLRAVSAEHIVSEDSQPGWPRNMVILDSAQHAWLALQEHLGSDDIAEFEELIRARQQRNLRLLDDLKRPGRRRHQTADEKSIEHQESGKKQSSRSS